MLNAIEKEVTKDSIWSVDEKEFKVTKVTELKGKIWVFYKQCKRVKSRAEIFGKEYSCYKEAFVARFTHYNNY